MSVPSAEPDVSTPVTAPGRKIAARLSVLDRYLPVWILATMGLGLLLGRAFPGLNYVLDSAKIDTVSVPIAIAATSKITHSGVL